MNDMICMKCGRDVALGQAFCKDCLEDMSHYPVNPATPIQIPVQPPAVHTSRRSNRPRKTKKLEEQNLRLRKLVRLQAIVIVCLLTLLIGLGIYGYTKLHTPTEVFRPGENYLTTEDSQQNGPTVP